MILAAATAPTRRYVCTACGAVLVPDAVRWRCDCGGLLGLEPAAAPTVPSIDELRARPPTLWRWQELLPFDPDAAAPARVTLGEGGTAVVDLRAGGRAVKAKLELVSPTLSFKDRGAVVVVAKALELGARHLVADSSGNAGTAFAAYAARAGLGCRVFVASGTEPAKLAQLRAHGAGVRLVAGTREDVAAAAIAEVEETGSFYASHVYSPFFFEGTKTLVLELWEQLGGRLPDVLVLPVGNGTLALGAARGVQDLHRAGLVGAGPRLVLVQAEGCAPIAAAFRDGASTVAPGLDEGTVARGIAIAAPARGAEILAVVRASGGCVVTVDDGAITAARRSVAAQGLYVEPTAAAAIAGVAAPAAGIGAGEEVAVPLCGAGLKAS